MSYTNVPTRSNSCFFQADGRDFALSLLHYTDMGEEWTIQLFERIGDKWTYVGRHIAQYFQNFNTEWAKFQNTSLFIASHFPEAEKRVNEAIAVTIPNLDNPAEFTAYDIALDVEYKDGHFQFNKPLPLSHNLLPK